MSWQLWTITFILKYIVILPLRVKQNSFILFFELEVAKCFYVSRGLFPDFGYSKLKCVFAIIWSYPWYMRIKIWGIPGIVWVNIRHLYEDYWYLWFALQTSNTILWTMYSLARNPNVQQQLYEEVSSVLKPGERATLENLQKMPLLRGCIKESLR